MSSKDLFVLAFTDFNQKNSFQTKCADILPEQFLRIGPGPKSVALLQKIVDYHHERLGDFC